MILAIRDSPVLKVSQLAAHILKQTNFAIGNSLCVRHSFHLVLLSVFVLQL